MSNDAANREQVLTAAMEKLKAEASAVINGIMSDLYSEYLPHVVGDTDANISFRVAGCMRNIISRNFSVLSENIISVSDSYGCDHYVSLHPNSWNSMVKPLTDTMGETLQGLRISELEDEVSRLKAQLSEAYRR